MAVSVWEMAARCAGQNLGWELENLEGSPEATKEPEAFAFLDLSFPTGQGRRLSWTRVNKNTACPLADADMTLAVPWALY